MKRFVVFLISVLAALCLALGLVGCGGAETAPAAPGTEQGSDSGNGGSGSGGSGGGNEGETGGGSGETGSGETGGGSGESGSGGSNTGSGGSGGSGSGGGSTGSGGSGESGESGSGESGGTAEAKPSEGLEYEPSGDGKSYIVKGIGTCKDTAVIIPAEHSGRPVTGIGENAFMGYSALKSITLPAGIKSIGYSAFGGCNDVEDVIYEGDLASWCAVTGLEGLMYSGETLHIDGKKVEGELVIPDGVTSIAAGAFRYNADITSVVIPDSVTSIKSSAFSSCYRLVRASTPAGVIGAFYGVEFITVTSGTTIPAQVFYNNAEVVSLTLPESITSIGSNAFTGCRKLVEIYDMTGLGIKAGDSGNGRVAYNAKDVYTSKDSKSKLSVSDDGFISYVDGEEAYLMGYVGLDTDLVLPAKLNGKNYEVYDFALYNEYRFKNITLPQGVTALGRYAIYGCTLRCPTPSRGWMKKLSTAAPH